MRTLQLTNPMMTGPDVAAWRRFLTSQGKLTGAPSSVFDSAAAAASRAYQSSRGLTPDAVIGPVTVSQAVRDGFRGPTGMMVAGMDASLNCAKFIAEIKAQNMQFVIRYYSLTASKAMGSAEAVALSAAGLQIGVVYQDVNNAITLFNADAGRKQGTQALTQAAAVHQPPRSAIYFAVDFDPTAADLSGALTDYFRAVNQVFKDHGSTYRVGIYGSGLACKTMRAAGLVSLTWLCGSTGFNGSTAFRTQADVIQIAPDRNIGTAPHQLNVDDDIALSADFGQFQLPAAHVAST